MKITTITARQILDSNGTPTIEVEITLENGKTVTAAVPSGASTGSHEAVELRDNNPQSFSGKSVLKAVNNINQIIAPAITSLNTLDQKQVDNKLIELDGTKNKSNLGANAILGVSIAVCKAAAVSLDKPTYLYIAEIFGNKKLFIPRPMVLMLEGGKHGNFATDIQEFMLLPQAGKFKNLSETLEANLKIFKALENILKIKGYSTAVGLEGAFCPQEINSNDEGLELLIEATTKAGFKIGQDFQIAVDFAASEFFQNGKYVLKSEADLTYTPDEWTAQVLSWAKKYPIFSLEDVHQEELWPDWASVISQLGRDHQIVGDDLTTTNIDRINKASHHKSINAVLIKLNQIGTVSETMAAVKLTHDLNMTTIVSHRSGETGDDFIADFAVGVGSHQCKFGALQREERMIKYNRLLEIERQFRPG